MPGDTTQMIRQDTEVRLKEISGRSSGTFGLAVLDLAGEEFFFINEQKIFPQASAIKIPILMEVYKQAGEGKFNLSDLRRISKGDRTPGSGVLGGAWELFSALTSAFARSMRFEKETPRLMFRAGLAAVSGAVSLSVRDLCVLMILVSDNTATNMLIDLVGMGNVNRTMGSLGCGQTRLRRRMMDLNARAQGRENVSTPADAARLMRILYRGEFISRAACDDILEILSKPKKSAIHAGVLSSIQVACKPGGITGVVTEWAIVFLKDRPYVIAAMEHFGANKKPGVKLRDVSAVIYQCYARLCHTTNCGKTP
jgi:beta-lactamase class A